MTLPVDALKGRRILLVEDEYFIADDLRRTIVAQGAAVVGPVGNLPEALDAVTNGGPIDGAILDINLRGEMVYPVADALKKKGVPFMFLTGYDARALPPAYANVPCCHKPIEMAKVIAALR
jgi:CheY-like chemotaxis protein